MALEYKSKVRWFTMREWKHHVPQEIKDHYEIIDICWHYGYSKEVKRWRDLLDLLPHRIVMVRWKGDGVTPFNSLSFFRVRKDENNDIN